MSSSKERIRSWKGVYDDIRKLHGRGLRDPRVDDLEALLSVARGLSTMPRDAERIEEALALAIDGFNQPQRDIVRLWFGLAALDDPDAPDTRGMTSAERHKTAWEYAGSPGAESTFRTGQATKRYETLAKRLVYLYNETVVGAAKTSDRGLVCEHQAPPEPEHDTSAEQATAVAPSTPELASEETPIHDDDSETEPEIIAESTPDAPPGSPARRSGPIRWPKPARRLLAAVVVALVACGIALVATGSLQSPPGYNDIWGPARPIYNYKLYIGNNNCADGANPSAYNGRCGVSANFPVFNSFVNTPYYGDERMFFDGYREQQSDGAAGDPIKNVTDGNRIVVLRIYVNNDAQTYPKEPERTIAYNTRVRVKLPPTTGNSLVAYAEISAKRAITVFDSVDLTGNVPFSLEYIPGSAILYNVQDDHNYLYHLSDEIIGSEGALIGVNSMNGILPPETHFSGTFVEIRVRAVPQGGSE